MSIKSTPIADEVAAEYLRPGDPALADYYPAWLDNLADDVTVEGSMLDGAVQGADAVRTIVVGIRELYGDSQEFHFAGPCGDNGWLEDYIARVEGNPLGCVNLVTRNAGRENPERRRELPATQLGAALLPPTGGEVRWYPVRRAVRQERELKRSGKNLAGRPGSGPYGDTNSGRSDRGSRDAVPEIRYLGDRESGVSTKAW